MNVLVKCINNPENDMIIYMRSTCVEFKNKSLLSNIIKQFTIPVAVNEQCIGSLMRLS